MFTVLTLHVMGIVSYTGDFQIAVLMDWVEYKEYINYGVGAAKCHLIFAFYFLNTACLN
jgi:hypothetical protein